MRTKFLCISVLRVVSGPRVKSIGRKNALTSPPNPDPAPVIYSSDPSKVMVPVLVLLFVALLFTLRGNLSKSYLVLFFLVFFSPFSIAITSLIEKIANLSAFRTFVRCAGLVLSVFSSSSCLGWFVCVEFLRPSQPNGIMSSAISLPNHSFTSRISPLSG